MRQSQIFIPAVIFLLDDGFVRAHNAYEPYRTVLMDLAMLHTVDRHGRITNVSDRWLESLGYRREEVLGRVITEFMGKEMQATLGGGRLEDVIATGELEDEPRDETGKPIIRP